MDRNEAECHRQTSSCTSDGSLEDFLILQRMPPKLKNDIKNNTPMRIAIWHQIYNADLSAYAQLARFLYNNVYVPKALQTGNYLVTSAASVSRTTTM